MKYADLTLPSPAANLACDEALLERCEEGHDEALRVWQSPTPFVVVGYANEVAREVHLDACRKRNIPVFRRCSGGGTVLQGPGCLNYALCLRFEEDSPLASITASNRYIMEKHRQLFEQLLQRPVKVQGHTDLAIAGRKFSGNAQRRKRRSLLFHGSFLLGLDLSLMGALLPMPSKQPDYRSDRSHAEFVCNVPLLPSAITEGLRTLWNAHEPLPTPPDESVRRLVLEKYSRDDWNFRF
ncbi:MAG: biotin/lipoate A/B protein ligase family protein [Verrucomicrobiia bacterium]